METIPAARGQIIGRNGWVLSRDISTSSFYASPYQIEDPDKVANRLAPLLGTDSELLANRLREFIAERRGFMWLGRRVPQETADAISKLKLRGVYATQEVKRAYPYCPLGQHFVGFVGTNEVGLAGIEQTQQEFLRSEVGRVVLERDATRREIGPPQSVVSPRNGADVLLTVDEHLQTNVEMLMFDALGETSATRATAIILKPQTGEVLAFAELIPTDANLYQPDYEKVEFDRVEVGRNHAVQDVYNLERITLLFNRALAVETSFMPKARKDKTASDPGREPPLLASFGFGEKTGIELPGETKGSVRTAATDAGAAPAFRVIASLIQLAAAFSVLANDGVRVQPHLIERIVAPDGSVIRVANPESRRVLSEQAARVMRDTLKRMYGAGRDVDGATTGGDAVSLVDTITVPREGRSASVLLGYTPAATPQYVIVVALDEPGAGESAVKSALLKIVSRVAQVTSRKSEVPLE